MDTESYENSSTADLINKFYVAIKVDRDERPDIDARYQAAVSAISGQGGWPLTAFLTPDGRVFFGGTYFPPDDRYGRMGFPNLLTLLAEVFEKEPDKVHHNAEQITRALQERLNVMPQPSDLSSALVSGTIRELLQAFDEKHGGFGSAPKFPNTSAIELLLAFHDQSHDTRTLNVAVTTLKKMARGGIHDQLAGGFHRYSTDEEWLVPHFEKMLCHNAGLLINYIHAYQATSDEEFRSVALDIFRYVKDVLSDRTNGGFYASQDADIEPGDDGSYFTWSTDELRALLNSEEFEGVRLYYGLTAEGHMHGRNGQNVLHRNAEIEEVASALGKESSEAIGMLESARQKMLAARLKRKSPFADTTIYADLNGMMIHATLETFKAFQDEEILQFALKSLNRILSEHQKQDGTISHRAFAVAGEAFLSDQIEIANACLDAYEVTGERRFFSLVEQIMQTTIEFFGDPNGGFFDSPRKQVSPGLLSVGIKPIQDSPVASPNSTAISSLNKLWILTEKEEYRNHAERSLHYFARVAQDYGMHTSQYFLSLNEFLNPPLHVALIAGHDDKFGKEMLRACLAAYRPGKIVTMYRPEEIPMLPNTFKNLPISSAGPAAYVCSQFSCAPPAFTSQSAIDTLRTFGRNRSVENS